MKIVKCDAARCKYNDLGMCAAIHIELYQFGESEADRWCRQYKRRYTKKGCKASASTEIASPGLT